MFSTKTHLIINKLAIVTVHSLRKTCSCWKWGLQGEWTVHLCIGGWSGTPNGNQGVSKAEFRDGQVVSTLLVHPPTSAYPALSAGSDIARWKSHAGYIWLCNSRKVVIITMNFQLHYILLNYIIPLTISSIEGNHTFITNYISEVFAGEKSQKWWSIPPTLFG